MDLVRRLLRGSQQAAASQASQASLAASQQRVSGGPLGAPSGFSCKSCSSATPPRIDHSGHLICADCGAVQEGEQVATRDEEEEFELLQSTAAMGAARVRSLDMLGSDAVAAALAAVGVGGPGASQGDPKGAAAAAAETPPTAVPAPSAAAAAAATQRGYDEDDDAEDQEEWGEGMGGAAAAGAGDAAAAAVAARVSRQQQQALGNYWQQPLLWLNAEEAAGETFSPDGAVSDAALLRCWALLLQCCCRLLQQEFGISDLLELEARKVIPSRPPSVSPFFVSCLCLFCLCVSLVSVFLSLSLLSLSQLSLCIPFLSVSYARASMPAASGSLRLSLLFLSPVSVWLPLCSSLLLCLLSPAVSMQQFEKHHITPDRAADSAASAASTAAAVFTQVLLQYLGFLARHELPVETYFCSISSNVIKIP